MPKIHYLPKFNSVYCKFTKNNKRRVKSIDKVLEIFAANPKHPSLKLEKLSGREIWTIRIDKGNRLFFVWSKNGDVAIFFFVGPHDSYKNI